MKRHAFDLTSKHGEPISVCAHCRLARRIAFTPKHGALTIPILLYRGSGARHWTTEKPACRS